MAGIHELSARQLAAAYAARELSPVEATRAALARIESWEPRINAMYRVSADLALEQARAAEARWQTGGALLALDGVPLTIKENIGTRGDPSPIGTRANEDRAPQDADAPPAARLREAGCVMLGKTTMPDYGMLSSGLSSLHGVTRNPWRLDRNPSGSLAAAGCAVESIRSFLTEEMLDGMCRFFEARSYNDLMQLSPGKRAKVLPFIAQWCSARAAQFSGRDVMQAYTQVMAMREAAVAASAPYEFVLSPTSPILPYEAELAAPGNDPRDALPHIAFTVAYNMSEQPAASINWGTSSEGLPIGVQLVGHRFDDAGVLRLARLVEELRPAQRRWPE